MKAVAILGLILSFNVSQAAIENLSLQTLAGKYEATHPQFPVKNTITVNVHGDVQFEEESPNGSIKCTGKATLEAAILKANLKCENGAEYEERVNLSNVTNLSRFKAPVFSSLYGFEIELNFVRIN